MPESLCTRRETCRLCGGRDLVPVIQLTPTPPANAFVSESQLSLQQPVFPLDVYFCNTCTHAQLLDVVDPSELFRNYVYVSGTSPVFVAHFKDYAASMIKKTGLKKNDFVFEVGSNDGTLLREFQLNGMRVLGVDPARKIAAEATSGGIETWPEFFDSDAARRVLDTHGNADLVVANNVMAHIDNLDSVVQSIKTVMSSKGMFVFEVSYLLDVYEKTLFDTIYHEHLDYHSVAPLQRFFAKHEMELIDVVRIPSHGGSIRCMVQKRGGPHAVSENVTRLITAENSAGLNQAKTLKEFSLKIDRLGHELNALLSSIRKSGKKVAGFGAPAKATTILYHFGITHEILDYIIDDSPLKQDLYSPGMHIPVLSSRAITERGADYLLVLAWNFAPAIIEKNRDYILGGGKLIIPIPELEVITNEKQSC